MAATIGGVKKTALEYARRAERAERFADATPTTPAKKKKNSKKAVGGQPVVSTPTPVKATTPRDTGQPTAPPPSVRRAISAHTALLSPAPISLSPTPLPSPSPSPPPTINGRRTRSPPPRPTYKLSDINDDSNGQLADDDDVSLGIYRSGDDDGDGSLGDGQVQLSSFTSNTNINGKAKRISTGGAVIGTSQAIEKEYFRLNVAPDPALIRPLAVLRRSLENVQTQWVSRHDYHYACGQLKSIRQDLTIQRIRDPFVVHVYETHARLALEAGDHGEFAQCQARLLELYQAGFTGCHAEFAGYRILHSLISETPSLDSASLIAEIFSKFSISSPTSMSDSEVKVPIAPSAAGTSRSAIFHALQVRSAVLQDNYLQFFKLYPSAPHMSRYMMDRIVPRMRVRALAIIFQAYRPSLPVSFIQSILNFPTLTSCISFLTEQQVVYLAAPEPPVPPPAAIASPKKKAAAAGTPGKKMIKIISSSPVVAPVAASTNGIASNGKSDQLIDTAASAIRLADVVRIRREADDRRLLSKRGLLDDDSSSSSSLWAPVGFTGQPGTTPSSWNITASLTSSSAAAIGGSKKKGSKKRAALEAAAVAEATAGGITAKEAKKRARAIKQQLANGDDDGMSAGKRKKLKRELKSFKALKGLLQ